MRLFSCYVYHSALQQSFKKYFVLAKRTVPEMNEGYVAKLSIILISLVSCGFSSIKFFIGDTKPTFNQVRYLKGLETL